MAIKPFRGRKGRLEVVKELPGSADPALLVLASKSAAASSVGAVTPSAPADTGAPAESGSDPDPVAVVPPRRYAKKPAPQVTPTPQPAPAATDSPIEEPQPKRRRF